MALKSFSLTSLSAGFSQYGRPSVTPFENVGKNSSFRRVDWLFLESESVLVVPLLFSFLVLLFTLLRHDAALRISKFSRSFLCDASDERKTCATRHKIRAPRMGRRPIDRKEKRRKKTIVDLVDSTRERTSRKTSAFLTT